MNPQLAFPSCVGLVRSFEELIATPFHHGVNALCWPRVLEGDFSEVAARLEVPPGLTHLSAEELGELELTDKGRMAVRHMLSDLELLGEHGLAPALDCVNGYTHPVEPPHRRTDVCSFHVDSATAEADTWLCTYHGDSSVGLPNDQAICRVDDPCSRKALLADFGGPDGVAFETWLNEHFHDLHYLPQRDAMPFSFGVFHLWRISTRFPGGLASPCVHRAPDPIPGQKRLLLIS